MVFRRIQTSPTSCRNTQGKYFTAIQGQWEASGVTVSAFARVNILRAAEQDVLLSGLRDERVGVQRM